MGKAQEFLNTVKDNATRKLGPLPVWAWGVVVAGGIWIWRGFSGSLDREDQAGKAFVPTAGEMAVVPSLAGGGAAPVATPSFGAPGGPASSLFFSGPDFSLEGPTDAAKSIIEQLIADGRAFAGTGGGGQTFPVPQPTFQPVAPLPPPPLLPPTKAFVPITCWRLYWMASGVTVGTYPTRLSASLAAQSMDASSSPPGSSMAIDSC